MKRINLADPHFEPTDEQLDTLSKRAFSQVADQRRASLERLRAQIRSAREEVLAQLEREKSEQQ